MPVDCLSRFAICFFFFGSFDTQIYSVDTHGGQLRWRFRTQGPVGSRPALSPDGRVVYMGSFDGSLYALAADSGKRVWRYETGSAVHSDPVLDANGSMLFFGSFDHHVYALCTRKCVSDLSQ